MPSMKKVQEFWQEIWSKEVVHNEKAGWIKREEDKMSNQPSQEWSPFSLVEVNKALAKSHNWKAPGFDKVPNFWLYYLKSSHMVLAKRLSELVEQPSNIPGWLTKGTTYLLPKTADTTNPKNYRPITCISTTYKHQC